MVYAVEQLASSGSAPSRRALAPCRMCTPATASLPCRSMACTCGTARILHKQHVKDAHPGSPRGRNAAHHTFQGGRCLQQFWVCGKLWPLSLCTACTVLDGGTARRQSPAGRRARRAPTGAACKACAGGWQVRPLPALPAFSARRLCRVMCACEGPWHHDQQLASSWPNGQAPRQRRLF